MNKKHAYSSEYVRINILIILPRNISIFSAIKIEQFGVLVIAVVLVSSAMEVQSNQILIVLL